MNFFKISSIAYLWLHEEHNIAARSICSKCWNWKAKLHGDTELRGTYETLGPVSTEGLWELAKNERLWCLGLKVARVKLPFSVAATFPFRSLKKLQISMRQNPKIPENKTCFTNNLLFHPNGCILLQCWDQFQFPNSENNLKHFPLLS